MIRREVHINGSGHLAAAGVKSGLALLFPAGVRATAAELESLLARPSLAAVALVSNQRGQGQGCLELLANGLTFNITSLAPEASAPVAAPRHIYGLPRDVTGQDWEVCLLAPGPHLADAGAMEPVVRTMAMLASALAQGLGAQAICWQPAASWMDVTYFARIVEAWCSGGAFPALGFSGMDRLEDGSVTSEGLAFFTGQELRVEARPGEPPADTVKLAVRLADRLVRGGPIAVAGRLTGPDAEALYAEPSPDGRQVRLRRQG